VVRLELCKMIEGYAKWAGALPQHRRRAVGEHISFVGLDVHKATIAVCVAETGRDGEVRFVGEIPNEPAVSDKLVTWLGRGGRTLRFAYEAGPCGYGVYRHLRGRGQDCLVVAPSLIPRKPGERIKTGRRDATALVRLHRPAS
jgi:transposase